MEQLKNSKTATETTEKRKVMPITGDASDIKENEEPKPDVSAPAAPSGQWSEFMKILETQKSLQSDDRPPRQPVTCMLDCELIDTLDECCILKSSRGDLVNAILRQFIEANIDALSAYKTIKKSLLK